MTETIPHPKNFCGGNFNNWLEVYLTGKCNGKCSFCIDKHGYKPNESLYWKELAKIIVNIGKKNILLLGGEPTLYPDYDELIAYLVSKRLHVNLTTNGHSLMSQSNLHKLMHLDTLNISIHHHDLVVNKNITGITLYSHKLQKAIETLRLAGVVVRINCNIIKGFIDSAQEIYNFIDWAKSIDADGVRFAELKNDDRFVGLEKIFPEGEYLFGLTDNPFINGCWHDYTINKMPVNFRQMCGLQTNKRAPIINPRQVLKKVLYYDGKIYNGWQFMEEQTMSKTKLDKIINKSIKTILEEVRAGNMTTATATKMIRACLEPVLDVDDGPSPVSGAGCAY